MLIIQTRKVEELEKKIEALNQKLTARELSIKNAGNIAEASLVLNEVFSSAQNAASQYLENVKQLEAEAISKLNDAKKDAEETIATANLTAASIIEDAEKKAALILSPAKSKNKNKSKSKKK